MKYLLDTNMVVYLQANNKKVVQNIKKNNFDDLFISSISIGEVLAKVDIENPQEQGDLDLIELVTQVFGVVKYGIKEALEFAKIRNEQIQKYKRQSRSYISDLQIASCAIANNMTLVTHNTKDFEMVKRLKIEDWFKK